MSKSDRLAARHHSRARRSEVRREEDQARRHRHRQRRAIRPRDASPAFRTCSRSSAWPPSAILRSWPNEYDQYGPLKADTAEAVVELLRPIQTRYAELAADPGGTAAILAKGAEKAQAVAGPTLARAEVRVGAAPAFVTLYTSWCREVYPRRDVPHQHRHRRRARRTSHADLPARIEARRRPARARTPRRRADDEGRNAGDARAPVGAATSRRCVHLIRTWTTGSTADHWPTPRPSLPSCDRPVARGRPSHPDAAGQC